MATRLPRWCLPLTAMALSACAALTPRSADDALLDAVRVHRQEAEGLEQAGRLHDSLERWRVIVTIDPNDQQARQKMQTLATAIQQRVGVRMAAGKAALQRRDRLAAQREFLAALRLDPTNRAALQQLYHAEELLGDQWAFAGSRHRSPASSDRHTGPANEAAVVPAADDAEESGEEVSFAEAAEVFRQGNYLGAIDAFDRVLTQQPGMREALEYQKLAYYNQGLDYLQKEQYSEALRMFEHLKRLQPDFKRLTHYLQVVREKAAEQHYLAGIREFKEQRLKEAIAEWDQALTLNHKLESARRSRERAQRMLKSLEIVK